MGLKALLQVEHWWSVGALGKVLALDLYSSFCAPASCSVCKRATLLEHRHYAV